MSEGSNLASGTLAWLVTILAFGAMIGTVHWLAS